MLNQFRISLTSLSKNMNVRCCGKGSVLVVSEYSDDVEVLGKTLTESGFSLTVAANIESAIYQAIYAHPVLIILDVNLPKINPIEICRQLQENEATKNIPVILLMDIRGGDNQIKCWEVGAVDRITKPIQPEEVLLRVTNQMTIRNLQKNVRELELRLQHQTTLQKLFGMMQERICQSFNLAEILDTTVREVRRFLQTDKVYIYQFQDRWSRTIAIDSDGLESGSIQGTTINHLPLTEHTESTQEQYQNILNQFSVLARPFIQGDANLIFPIRKGQILWGLLVVENYSQTRKWHELEIELMKHLVRQIGITIQQAELYQRLESANQELHRLATVDSLTQLANRYWFNIYINQEWRQLARAHYAEEQARESQSCISLIMCDVDFFKLYNDTYGHLAGDICLQQVAEAIRETVHRSTDLVARYGGEEFAVILPNTNTTGAFYIAEQIRNRVKALRIPHARSPIDRCVTLSLGVSTIVPNNESAPETLIAMADKALYYAKEQGRDRTQMLFNPDDSI